MHPLEVQTRTEHYLKQLRHDSERATALRQALGTWRRRAAHTLLAWVRRLEPELLERRPRPRHA